MYTILQCGDTWGYAASTHNSDARPPEQVTAAQQALFIEGPPYARGR